MDRNGKALISAAVVGIMVVVGVHYLHGRGEESPRAGCPTVVVTASVDKSDLMAEAAARYNASDRRVGADCYGISVRPMASGVAEARLAQDRWDESWGPVPDAWTPAASTWLQLLRHDRAAQDRSRHTAGEDRIRRLDTDSAGDARTEGTGAGLAAGADRVVGSAGIGR